MQRTKYKVGLDLDDMVEEIVDSLKDNILYPSLHLSKVKKSIKYACGSKKDLISDAYDNYLRIYQGNTHDFENLQKYVHKFGSSDPRGYDSDTELLYRFWAAISCGAASIYCCLLSPWVFFDHSVDVNVIAPMSGIFGLGIGFFYKEIKNLYGRLKMPDGYHSLCKYHKGLDTLRDNLLDELSGYSVDGSLGSASDGTYAPLMPMIEGKSRLIE